MTKEEQEKKQEHAKLLYTKENITSYKELAERVGVTEKTIAKWVETGGWKKLKRNILLTREEQMVNMMDELSELNEFIKNKKEGERYADQKEAQIRRQLVKDIKDLETKAMLPEIINALTQFLDFVRRENIDDTKLLAGYVDSFLKIKLRS
ncbi:transcriptional regulator [Flavobacterium sp. HSC-61S13]|uniref:transcriptional regulator n=1 Tax=Flavobacterium sp. HSC-61S13 TaxID=2910963 RepID=UPI00209D6E36|nr:transcriptional regulator [Flavobacterium sp. HSC-61S13]MCP1997292.1 5'-3' exonuclease [Flavobacterium sp. HSC-61S13]